MPLDLERYPTTVVSRDPRNRAWAQQCVRIKTNGERCRAWTIVGSTVCIKHGGQFGVVRVAAERRLSQMGMRAIETLYALMDEKENSYVRLRAARECLRIVGITAASMKRQSKKGDAGSVVARKGRAVAAPVDEQIEALLARMQEPDGSHTPMLETKPPL